MFLPWQPSLCPKSLVVVANRGTGCSMIQACEQSCPSATDLWGFWYLEAGRTATINSPRICPSTTIVPIPLDVASDRSIKSTVECISTMFGRPETLANNANWTQGAKLGIAVRQMRQFQYRTQSACACRLESHALSPTTILRMFRPTNHHG